MISPAFKGITGAKNHFIGETPNPNNKPQGTMHFPILPFVQAKNMFRPTEISEDVPMKMEKVMSGPIYQGKKNDPYNEYNEIPKLKPHEPPMVGPIYPNIDTCNKFNPKTERVKGPMDRVGPVFDDIDGKNVFGTVVTPRVHGELAMVSPCYRDMPGKHQFVPPIDRKKGQKPITYPVKYEGNEHKFQPPLEKTPGILSRCAPVYHGIDAGKSNKFLPEVKKSDTGKNFLGPIYTGIETKSKYYPQAEKKPEVGGGLSGPTYKVDSANNYSPDKWEPPRNTEQHAPIYHGIELTNQFNPANCYGAEDRIPGILDMAGPVYGVETKNCYGPVLVREEAPMPVRCGPVYKNAQGKHAFLPPKEKGYGEIANCGPVRRYGIDPDFKYIPTFEKVPHAGLARCAPVYHGIDAGKSPKYKPEVKPADVEKKFMGPIYTGIESKSKYYPQAEAKPPVPVELLGPTYKVDRKANYAPEKFEPPKEMIQFGPIYSGIEPAKGYNPAGERVKGILDMAGPVYDVETKNVYGPIPPREDAPLPVRCGPVYKDAQGKHSFQPPPEKGYGELANVGPVRRGIPH